MDGEGTNGWEEWGKHVLTEQRSQNDRITFLTEQVTSLRVEVAIQKVRISAFNALSGAIGALLPTLGLLIWWIVKNAK